METPDQIYRIAIFASGEGALFQALVDSQEELGYQVVALVVSRINCGAADRAKSLGVPVLQADQIFSGEQQLRADLYVLAGFLKKVPIGFVQKHEGAIINTHPALLPRHGGKGMYGRRVHQAVLDAGDKESGFTVHYVDEEYDHGQVIMQKQLFIEPSETVSSLETKVKKLERETLPEVVAAILSGQSWD